MSRAVGDSAENVTANFELACQALGVDARRTASCHLVHGNRVLRVDAPTSPDSLEQADALVSNTPGLCLTMRFADCAPLLFHDPVTGSIGLAHAGWRGTMQNIMGRVVEAMQHHFDSRPEDIRVVIGPGIGPCCYEVKEDVLAAARISLTNPDSLFEPNGTGVYFNVWAANSQQAQEAGLTEVTVSRLCTACRTNEFFSHRAENGQTGRFGVFLSLPNLSKEGGHYDC